MKNPLIEYRSYRLFFTARVTSTMASQMMLVVMAWQMYDLTNSAFDLGLTGLVQFLPSLLLTLVAGQVADRVDRRRILTFSQGGQLLVTLWLVAATMWGWIDRESILIASAALGFFKAFQGPANQSLPPQLVPAAVLPRALATNASAQQLAAIMGPSLGGFIYVAGADVAYLVSAALYLIAVIVVPMIRMEHPPRVRKPIDMENLFAGFVFIWRRKEILGAISLDLFAVLLGGAVALLPIYARDILHVGPWGLGLLRAAPAIGALLMSLYLAQRPIMRNAGRVMFGSVALYGIFTLVFALSTSFLLSMLALALTGVFDMISVVIRHSLVQLDTPNDMRGRVSAVNSIFTGASSQLGQFESGVTAEWFGTVPSVVVGGLGTILVVVAGVKLFPTLFNRDTLVPKAEEPAPVAAAAPAP